jgi:ABC-2 type transport system permease protein
MKAFMQLYAASFKEFARERMTIFWTMAFPVLFILLFGVIFSNSNDTKLDVGLVLEDRGPSGATLAEAFKNIPVFKITEGAREAELAALRKGDRRGVIVLPVGMSQAIAQNKPVALQVYYDPAQQQQSQIVLGVVRDLVQQADRRISGTPVLLSVDAKSVQAQQTRFIDFFVPGMLAMAIMQLGLFGTAQPIVQLRDQGVLRRLSATPLPRVTILASQVALRLTVALLQAAVILLLGMLVFQVPMLGSWPVLVGFVLLGGLMFISLGYVIAAFSKNQESAAGISSVLSFPLMFLSGLFFPIDFMPDFLKPIVQIIPLTYLADALRQIMVGSNPMHPLAFDAALIGAWMALCMLVAVRFFKWE